ncbi:MAG: hypothetical protein EOO39_15960 [Cytophagaceae bacterium]|nr:MAG: hypothetical protein EOO39_15960 [Cytophagaceae bacterium]
MHASSSLNSPAIPTQASHGQLIQTLLNLASPGTARYQAHQLRLDGVYRVVVRTADGFQLVSIPASALLLAELGILVDSDRYAISRQLDQADKNVRVVDQLVSMAYVN